MQRKRLFNTFSSWHRVAGMTLLLPVLLALPSWATVTVSVRSEEGVVAPGEIFAVTIDVTEAGASFNGYETEIVYDPGVLTYVSVSPSYLQEGEYFPNNCGVRHHTFDPTPGRLKVVHVLFCAGMSVNGPGELYVLQFQAPSTPQVVSIQLQSTIFAYAGLNVTPLEITNLNVTVGEPTDTIGPGVRQQVSISAAPNPFNPNTRIRVEGPEGRRSIAVYDLRGRLVRHLGTRIHTGDVQYVHWDGRNNEGASLASGVYLVAVRQRELLATKRVVLLR